MIKCRQLKMKEIMKKKITTMIVMAAMSACMLMGCGESSDYTFKCVDNKGAAVEGVKLEACTDTMCRTADTNAEGIATFSGDSDSYTMHVLKVPDGYEYTGEEEFVVSGGGKVTEVTFAAK